LIVSLIAFIPVVASEAVLCIWYTRQRIHFNPAQSNRSPAAPRENYDRLGGVSGAQQENGAQVGRLQRRDQG
jgi:hypothetical protein